MVRFLVILDGHWTCNHVCVCNHVCNHVWNMFIFANLFSDNSSSL